MAKNIRTTIIFFLAVVIIIIWGKSLELQTAQKEQELKLMEEQIKIQREALTVYEKETAELKQLIKK